VTLSFWVSGTALLISALAGVPLCAWLGLRSIRGRWMVGTLVYTGMGLPSVVAGLAAYLLLARSCMETWCIRVERLLPKLSSRPWGTLWVELTIMTNVI
jgi:ABC-type sulfate transport system permease component